VSDTGSVREEEVGEEEEEVVVVLSTSALSQVAGSVRVITQS